MTKWAVGAAVDYGVPLAIWAALMVAVFRLGDRWLRRRHKEADGGADIVHIHTQRSDR